MKKLLMSLLAVLTWVTFGLLPCNAVPLANSNDGMDYLLKDPPLSHLTAGLYFGQMKRDIKRKGSETTLTSQRFTGYVGTSLFRWLTVYVTGGQNEAKTDNSPYGDSELIFGGGVSANLLNHFIREATPMEDTFRINFGAQLLNTKSDVGTSSVDWNEISAELTFAVVNHTTGNKDFVPESIALYAGPAISLIQSSDFDAKNEGGVVGGLEIFMTDSFAIDLRVEYFGQASASAGINLHF